MFVTLEEVKTFLGIAWTSQDARLTAIIWAVETRVENMVWDLNQNEKVENICLESIRNTNIIPLSNINVIDITELNGVDFSSKINKQDYFIYRDDSVEIVDLGSYVNNLKFKEFEIKYTSGYTEIPSDIKMAVSLLVGVDFAKSSSKTITAEKAWDRQVNYWSDQNSDGVDMSTVQAMGIIEKYRPLNLKNRSC